jgi:hypothetical protein
MDKGSEPDPLNNAFDNYIFPNLHFDSYFLNKLKLVNGEWSLVLNTGFQLTVFSYQYTIKSAKRKAMA